MLLIPICIFVFVLIAVVYVFLIMPRVVDRADMDLLSTDYAHRGLHSKTIPENSLAAFSSACNAGYGIELDVQLSKDGKIFVFHDDTLERMCGIKNRIQNMTSAEIKRCSLLGTSEKIPLLAEVLELVDGQVPLLIEVKYADNAIPLSKRLCLILDTYPGAFAIQSFDPTILSFFKKYRPRFARGQLVSKFTLKNTRREAPRKMPFFVRFSLTHMLTNVLSRPDFISIDGRRLGEISYIIVAKIFKAKSFVWTIRKKEQYELCREKELYSIFENIRPD